MALPGSSIRLLQGMTYNRGLACQACSSQSREFNHRPVPAPIAAGAVIPKRPVLRSAAKRSWWIWVMWRLWCTPVHLSLHKTRIYHGKSWLSRTGDLISADGVRGDDGFVGELLGRRGARR